MLLKQDKLRSGHRMAIHDTIADIDAATWDAIGPGMPFYQAHQFLQLIESIQPDLQFRYVLLYDQEEPVAAVYMQLLDFAYRNLVNYSGEAGGGVKNQFKQYMAKRTTKLLNLGNVFFTGDKGLLGRDEALFMAALPEICTSLRQTFKQGKPTAFLIANIYLQDESRCISFCQQDFHPFTTEPDMFLLVNRDWQSFEGYLGALSSKYRVRARKVLQVSEPIKRRELSAADIAAQQASLERLYNNVVNHVAFNMATLNTQFFLKVKAMYGDRCSIFGYYLDGVMVGFACLFHVDPGMLHIHYIGLDYEVNKTHKLYNRMLLDFVRFAIEHDLEKVHFGRTATEIKTTIGAEPNPLQAYLRMSNPLVNASLPYFLKRIKPQPYTARNPFR